MNFFGDSTEDLFEYLTGEKLLSHEEYEKYLNDLIEKTSDQDEINELMKKIHYNLNLKHTEWKAIYKTLKLIEVLIKSAAKDYVVDKNNLEYRYGINNQMIEKNNYLTFSRMIANAKDNWLLEKIVSN